MGSVESIAIAASLAMSASGGDPLRAGEAFLEILDTPMPNTILDPEGDMEQFDQVAASQSPAEAAAQIATPQGSAPMQALGMKLLPPLKRKPEQETAIGTALKRKLQAVVAGPLSLTRIKALGKLAEGVSGYLQATATGVAARPKTMRNGIGLLGGLPDWAAEEQIFVDPYGRKKPLNRTSWFEIDKLVRDGFGKLRLLVGLPRPEDQEPEFAPAVRAELEKILGKPFGVGAATAFTRAVEAAVPVFFAATNEVKTRDGRVKMYDQVVANALNGTGPMPALPEGTLVDQANPGMIAMPGAAIPQAVVESLPEGQNAGFDAPMIDELPEETEIGAYSQFSPYTGGMPQENFGAKLTRELLAALPKIMGAKNSSPEALVKASIAAEDAGRPKLAAKLRDMLGVVNPEEAELDADAPARTLLNKVLACEKNVGMTEEEKLMLGAAGFAAGFANTNGGF